MALLCVALAGTGCKKGSGGGGGGGGGGGWLVGSSGMMVNVHDDQTLSGYALDQTNELDSIACRGPGEAWVAGDAGLVLYTNDGGKTWSQQAVPTQAHLRSVATQDDGPVFIAGDGTLLESDDTGATWRELGDGASHYRSVAASRDAGTMIAVADDGSVFGYDGAGMVRLAQLEGARAVAVSLDGRTAMVAGHGLWRSLDAGETWQQLQLADGITFDDVRIDSTDAAIAVGAAGAIGMIDANGNVLTQHVGTADFHALRIAGAGWGDAKSYAAGDGGQLWMSADAGWTWTMGPNVGGTVLGIDEIGIGHR